MPARYVLERADWKAAAALPMTPTEYPQADSLTHFTRGLGLARLGDRAGANRGDRRDAAAPRGRWRSQAMRIGPIAPRSRSLAVSAWVALAGGAPDKAVDADAAGRRRRRRQHQARGDGESPLSDARAARRSAAGGQASGGGARRIHERAEAISQSLSWTVRRGTGGRGRRRFRRAREYYAKVSNCRDTPTASGPNCSVPAPTSAGSTGPVSGDVDAPLCLGLRPSLSERDRVRRSGRRLRARAARSTPSSRRIPRRHQGRPRRQGGGLRARQPRAQRSGQ